jgi:uncharacterized membrane protein
MHGLLIVLTFLAAVGSGVVGGVFFAFSVFVMTALARLPASEGIAAMQQINVTVINPLFLGAFLGTGVVAAMLLASALWQWGVPGSFLLLIGSGLYLAGNLVVTMAGNVPLNNGLAAVDPEGPGAAELWQDYLARWNLWNHVRTVTGVAAAALLTVAFCNLSAAP